MKSARRLLPALALGLASLPLLAQAPRPAASASAPAVAPATPDERVHAVERDPQLLQRVLRDGQRVAAFCANCHGDGGNSTKPDVPNLAGQNPTYLLEQVRQFADGRRKDLFMEGLTRALSDNEKVAIAVFYSHQEVQPHPATDPALAARGKAYYERVCFVCHGDQGRGSEQFARIAGQQPAYLMTTLKRYRDGSVKRANAMMEGATRRMSDADLAAVVAYVSSMK